MLILIKETKAFFKGIARGFDWWYYIAFKQKLPRWVCWLIGIMSIPLNLIVILAAMFSGRLRELIKSGIKLSEEVDAIRENE